MFIVLYLLGLFTVKTIRSKLMWIVGKKSRNEVKTVDQEFCSDVTLSVKIKLFE